MRQIEGGEETSKQLIDGMDIRPGTQIIAAQEYKKNPNNTVGEELGLNQLDILHELM